MSSQRSERMIENPTLEQLFLKVTSRRWQNTRKSLSLEQLFLKTSSQRWPKTIHTLEQIFSKRSSQRWQKPIENQTLEHLFSKMSSQRLQKTVEKENQTLELKIISASDVSYMDRKDKMAVYAVVSIKDEYTQKKQAAKTPIDCVGGSNPTWNHTVNFSVNEKAAGEGLLTVNVKLYSYWLQGEDDIYLGEVSVSLKELLASNPLPPFTNGNVNNKMKLVTYPIKFIEEAKPNAKLTFSYRFSPVEDPNPGPTGSCHQLVIYSPPQLQTTTVTKLTLELVIKYAKDIEKVTNILDEMDVYASVTIRDGKRLTVKHRSVTPIVFCAYENPKWDHAVKFSLDEPLAREGSSMLVVELMSHRPFLGDKQIGEVKVSVRELLRLQPLLANGDSNDMMLVTEHVSGSYGKRGTLSFTYRFLTEQVTLPKPTQQQLVVSTTT